MSGSSMPIEGEQSRDTISRSAAALAVNAWGWRCWDTVLKDGLVVAGGAVAVCSESGTEAATGKGGVDFTCAGTGTGNGGVATCCAVITGADVCTSLSTGAGEGVLKRSIIFTIHNCICICINARSKADWEADPAADPSTITGTNESVPARFWLDGIRNWFPIRGSKKEGCWCTLMDGSICGKPGAGSCTPRVESDGWGCLLLSPMTIPWFFRSCINCAVWCEDGLHGTSPQPWSTETPGIWATPASIDDLGAPWKEPAMADSNPASSPAEMARPWDWASDPEEITWTWDPESIASSPEEIARPWDWSSNPDEKARPEDWISDPEEITRPWDWESAPGGSSTQLPKSSFVYNIEEPTATKDWEDSSTRPCSSSQG